MNDFRKMADRELTRLEAEFQSRRRLIRDICAATGWVFLSQATIARASEPLVQGDAGNDDRAWGSVKGRVLFNGDVPEVKEIELEGASLSPSDLAWFKSMGPVINQEWVIDRESKAVQWVFVWLLPEDPTAKFTPHPSLLEMPEEKRVVIVDQEPSGYVPHAVALQAGQDLLMRNQGPVAHVLNFTGFANEAFNKAMAPGTEALVENIKPERAAIQVNCPPHPWERMWLRCFEHPYFAVTDAQGQFEIPLAPAGNNRLVVWHETAGFLGGRDGRNGSIIEVEGAAITDVGDLLLTPRT